jgi:hypothetical protein
MRLTFCKGFLVLLLSLMARLATGQQVQIVLGPDEIGENQSWTITITVQNDRLKTYDNFPDLDGFRKRGTSSQSSTSIINGQVSSSQSVVMTYLPTKQGTFTIPDFTLKVNDKPIRVAGKRVKVGPPVSRQQNDPFSNFFDRPNDDFFGRGETEFVDVKEDAFLALTTNKNEIFTGEGVNVTLSFFVASGNRAPLQFYELPRQLSDILKKIRPTNCWEENFNIENIEGEPVTIGGKDYNQYKIYQATLFPLNAENMNFPSVGLEMIKYKVAKNPSFFGQNRQEDFKTFYSKPKKVVVKQLPPHPLRDVVAVGDYHLDEGLRNTTLETGKSTPYQFNIYGEGNISAIEKPVLKNDGAFEFYDPNIQQNINHANSRVTGTKSFNYFLIPHEPGQYKLGDYFQWVFFNPEQKKYDTLRSDLVVNVEGESKKNEAILSNDMGSFYDKIGETDNTIHTVADSHWKRWAFNGFLMLAFSASIYLFVKRKTTS